MKLFLSRSLGLSKLQQYSSIIVLSSSRSIDTSSVKMRNISFSFKVSLGMIMISKFNLFIKLNLNCINIIFIEKFILFSCLKVLHQILDDENAESHSRVEVRPNVLPPRNRRRSGDSINSQGFGSNKRMSNVSSEGGDKLNRSIIEQVEEAVVESITVIKSC